MNTWILYSQPRYINIVIGLPLLLYILVTQSSPCLTDCLKVYHSPAIKTWSLGWNTAAEYQDSPTTRLTWTKLGWTFCWAAPGAPPKRVHTRIKQCGSISKESRHALPLRWSNSTQARVVVDTGNIDISLSLLKLDSNFHPTKLKSSLYFRD